MAKMWNPNWVKKTPTTAIEQTEEATVEVMTQQEAPVKKEATIEVPASLLERLEQLEKQVATKADKGEKEADKKKRYEWPRKYHFQMWLWQPVLSYSSKRKDPTKEFVYKNLYWKEESNHYLDLTLADGTVVESEVNEYNSNKWRSEKQFAEVIGSGNNITWYKFTTKEYWTFIVSPNLING
jgi:hypothetical protein